MNKLRKTKVLIIDDNISILEYLKTVLNKYNFEISTSTNGYDGLQEVAKFKPDIVFLDLMMPNLDGLQLLQLKKVLIDIKDIPVIVISANAGRNNVIAAMEAGADRVLAKPINLKQLKSFVDELLGGSYFEAVVTSNEESANKIPETMLNTFIEKFEEYKDLLIDALHDRKSEDVIEIVNMLKEYSKECGNSQIRILHELSNQEFSKPSDWMFAEIKIKELDNSLKQTENK